MNERTISTMNLNELAKQIHETAIDKGWWGDLSDYKANRNGSRNFGEVIALIHSEASEALEDYRHGLGISETVYHHPDGAACDASDPFAVCETVIPGGIPIEFADIIIRVLDACAGFGIDIDAAMAEKIAYNRTRPQRHGGKRA